MISIQILIYLGFAVLGIDAAECSRQRVTFEPEILCYTSSDDIEKLENLLCKCTTLIYDGGDLQNLNYSNIERFQGFSKKINPTLAFFMRINDDWQLSDDLPTDFLQEVFQKVSSLFEKVDGIELNIRGHKKQLLMSLIEKLKDAEMNLKLTKRKKIFLALSSNLKLLAKEYDIRNLNKYIDLFTISTHYLTDSNDNYKTFHPSRLMGLYDVLNTDSLVDLVYGLGADKKKIIISLPVNAYKFRLSNKYDNAPRARSLDEKPSLIDRKELCSMMTSGQWTIERDEDFTAPYAFNHSIWIAFEDSISTRIKGKYVILRNLGGIAVHNIEDDNWTDCGKPLTEHIYNLFFHNTRMSRAAVFDSLENDTNYLNNQRNSHLTNAKISNFRISRIVDSNGTMYAVRQNTQIEFTCFRQGYFTHPKSCNRFYRCVKFNQALDDYSVFEFDCPSGLAFDETTEVCVWPGSLSQGLPCHGSSEIAPSSPLRFRCPGEGYYADPQNCRWFFACINLGNDELIAYEFRCPYGLLFDEEKLICEWPWLVAQCNNNIIKADNQSFTIPTNKLDESSPRQMNILRDNSATASFTNEYNKKFIESNATRIYNKDKNINHTLSPGNRPNAYDLEQYTRRNLPSKDKTSTKYFNNTLPAISKSFTSKIDGFNNSDNHRDIAVFTTGYNNQSNLIINSIEFNNMKNNSTTNVPVSSSKHSSPNYTSGMHVTPIFLSNSTQRYHYDTSNTVITDSLPKLNIQHNGEKTIFVSNFDSSTENIKENSTQQVQQIDNTKIVDNNENINIHQMGYNTKRIHPVSSSVLAGMHNETSKNVDSRKDTFPNYVSPFAIKKNTENHKISPNEHSSYQKNPFLNGALDNKHRQFIENLKNLSLMEYNNHSNVSRELMNFTKYSTALKDYEKSNENQFVKSSYIGNPFLRGILQNDIPYNNNKDNKKLISKINSLNFTNGSFSWNEADTTTKNITNHQEHTTNFYHTSYIEPTTQSNKNTMFEIEPISRNKSKVIIKYSDLHPILLKKLRAECKCKGDPFRELKYSKEPLLIDSSMGVIDLRNYYESNIYVDLGSSEKFEENNKKNIASTTNLSILNTKIRDRLPLQESEKRDARSFDNPQLYDNSTTITDDKNSLPWNKIECARPGLFRHVKFCNKFYACYWDKWKKKFTLRVFNCPVHLTFDNQVGACNWPSKGPACQSDQLLL